MPPLRPPGVGEPTVPTTRSASAERAFCFGAGASTCRPFPCCLRPSPCCPRPSVLLLSAPSVPLPRARPSLCLVPVHSGAAHACPSPFISALPVPVCPTLPVPVCPTLSGHIYSCAARRHPFLAARASRSPHCPSPFHLFPVRGHPVGRLRHDGRSLDLSPRGSIYIGAAENSDGSTTEQRLNRQKPGFCGTAGCAGCRSRTGALSSRRRYFCGKLL